MRDEPVEHRLPVPVAGEVVVRDEEVRDALGEVVAHDALHVLRRCGSAIFDPAR